MRFHPLLYLLYPFVAGAFLVTLIIAYAAYGPTAAVWARGWLVIIADVKRGPDGAPELDERGRTITRIWGRPSGQCLGAPACSFASVLDSVEPDLNVHERGHLWHALIVNAIAHAILVPLGVWLMKEDVSLDLWLFVVDGGWWLALSIVLSQAAFGLSYGGHYLWWRYVRTAPARYDRDGKRRPRWYEAYRMIWSEQHAYRVQAEYLEGARPWAWGG